jgi:hypothetical protein
MSIERGSRTRTRHSRNTPKSKSTILLHLLQDLCHGRAHCSPKHGWSDWEPLSDLRHDADPDEQSVSLASIRMAAMGGLSSDLMEHWRIRLPSISHTSRESMVEEADNYRVEPVVASNRSVYTILRLGSHIGGMSS